VEAAGLIGSDQVQTRASLGGNLCNASPAADTGPALVVNDVEAVITSTRGERVVPVSDVTTGPGKTSLRSDEFVVEFIVQRPGPRVADSYQRFTPRTEMDIAVVGAGARVVLSNSGEVADASVVLGAVAPTTLRVEGIADALANRPLDDEGLERAAALSREQAAPISDKRGTRDFRIHIAGVLTKRVLRIAAERAANRK
jgi:carbon-monoxide dehydrogenase medium subunit